MCKHEKSNFVILKGEIITEDIPIPQDKGQIGV
jgi:hypothetical protein